MAWGGQLTPEPEMADVIVKNQTRKKEPIRVSKHAKKKSASKSSRRKRVKGREQPEKKSSSPLVEGEGSKR